MSTRFNRNGLVIYEGKSRLDNQPIVMLLTGLSSWSSNRKTGAMYQTWILRSDQHPQDALKSGADKSICGNCPLRPNKTGKRICYVNPITLGQVYKQYLSNRYDRIPKVLKSLQLGVRLGSYGDPTAVPLKILKDLVNAAPFHTGYTRQWKDSGNQSYKSLLMASCFSRSEQQKASDLGWRTFRVKLPDEEILSTEIQCPASKELTYPTTCQMCKRCNGGSLVNTDVTVNVHGLNSKLFNLS